MKLGKPSVKLISCLGVVICFSAALYIRTYFPFEDVFHNGLIKFTGNDAYYFMRLVDNLVHNFPHLISFDPYFTFPGGEKVSVAPFFSWLLAGITWLIGLGAPTERTVDVVAVYFPAILAALTVIPVYIIGKELLGRWAGIIAAALLAILPGEFLGRSILGFTDYHVAEVLFSTTAMMFLLLAVTASQERKLTFGHLRDRATTTTPVIYALLAGVFLGLYLITWLGALLFVFIITIYVVVQSIIDHLRRQSTEYLCLVSVITFLVALMIYAPVYPMLMHLASLGIAIVIPIALTLVSRFMTQKKIRPAYYPLVLAGLGGLGLAIFYAITPSLFRDMLSAFAIFTPRGVELTTLEMQPLLSPEGEFTWKLAWGNFTTSFFIGLISLGILIYLSVKQGSARNSLLVVWSLVILATALGQRRFAYYFAVNVALLTGYISWQFLRLVSFKREKAKIAAPKKAALKVKPPEGSRLRLRGINLALAAIIIFFLVLFPNIAPSIIVASQARFAPSDAWVSSLLWLRQNSPEPLGDPNFYYQLYQPPKPGQAYRYPESAYGVMSWWDYGYLILRIAHRLPYSNPGSSNTSRATTARFFLSQDEDSARPITEKLDTGYIAIDIQTATTKLYAVAQWAEKNRAQFYDLYFQPAGQMLTGAIFYYPEYYRSMVVRLYNFDGQAVTPKVTKVIAYENQLHPEAGPIKVITNTREFSSYEEAAAYISSQKSGNYRIVNDNPFVSPVPLSALKQYQLVHSSDNISLPQLGLNIPEVKIFECVPD